MSDFRFKLIDAKGNVLFNNLRDRELVLIENLENVATIVDNNKSLRVSKVSTDLGIVFGASSSSDYIKSSRKLKTNLEPILQSISFIEKVVESHRDATNASTRRLIHNLTSLNAHTIQEVYSLVPQELLASKKDNHVGTVEKIVSESPREAALALLAIAKANVSMKTEFCVFKNLFNPDPHLQKKHHVVHKVLMNVFYLFFPDFTDKNVYVVVNESTLTAWFDYESIHVALYHLIDNSAKYIKPNSRLYVNIFELDKKSVVELKMESLKIDKNEIEYIFEEGFSGGLAKKTGKSGDGIGTFIMKKMIELNCGELKINIKPETIKMMMGIEYQENIFSIVLPRTNSEPAARY